jgi:hypothetical protein
MVDFCIVCSSFALFWYFFLLAGAGLLLVFWFRYVAGFAFYFHYSRGVIFGCFLALLVFIIAGGLMFWCFLVGSWFFYGSVVGCAPCFLCIFALYYLYLL